MSSVNPATQAPQQPASPSRKMIIVLTLVAMMSGLLVVLVSQFTAPLIAENQRLAIEQAVKTVIPGVASHSEFFLEDGRLVDSKSQADSPGIYAGYDEQGRLLGIALRGAAQGYADMIHLLFGYDPKCECIRGIRVLKLAETPGLGDKIIHDKQFLKNFEALDARVSIDNAALANAIVTVKAGTKQHAWEIDAISGATISSVAVGKAINDAAQQLLPVILPQLHRLEKPAENGVQP